MNYRSKNVYKYCRTWTVRRGIPWGPPSSILGRAGYDYIALVDDGQNRSYRPEFSGRKVHSRRDRFCKGHPPGTLIISLGFPRRYLL